MKRSELDKYLDKYVYLTLMLANASFDDYEIRKLKGFLRQDISAPINVAKTNIKAILKNFDYFIDTTDYHFGIKAYEIISIKEFG